MLMTDREVKAKKLISLGTPANFGATSYDLAVSSIIDSKGTDHGVEGYCIKPQEIVWVVSKERIALPSTITAHAMIRTSLCNKGLLALNIGIVDPGWDGPIATSIVNFSNAPYLLLPREKFLRLSFMRHRVPDNVKPIQVGSHQYMLERRKLATETFGSTFLNIDQVSEEVRSRLLSKVTERLVIWGTMAAVIFAFLAVFIAVCTYVFPVKLVASSQEIEMLQSRISQLERLIPDVEKPRAGAN